MGGLKTTDARNVPLPRVRLLSSQEQEVAQQSGERKKVGSTAQSEEANGGGGVLGEGPEGDEESPEEELHRASSDERGTFGAVLE